MSAAPTPARAVFLVARRELYARLRTRAFTVSTAVSLVLLVVFVLAQSTLFDDEHPTRIGLNGQATAITGALRDAGGRLDRPVETREVTDLAAGRDEVADGELDVLVSGAPAELKVLVRGTLDPDLRIVLNGLVQQQVLHGLLASDEDLDANQVLATVARAGAHVDQLEPPDPRHDQRLALALVMVSLLYLSLLLVGSSVAQGVVEEKSSRVVEVLLATVRPGQLLLGKIVGVGLVGLAQVLAVGVVGLLVAIVTGVVTIPGAAFGMLAWGVLWYVLGYLLYATVFGAFGSLVSRQEDVQPVLMPITIVLLASFVLGFAVLSRNPAGTAATVLSLVPPLSPILMPGRLALAAAPLWQVALSLVLTVATVAALGRLGAVVYRNSVLHMGPRLRLRDVVR